MSHHQIREDKICQNCSHFVSERFCPNCGQENTETRQSFHHLFTHFAEDLVHYDGKFWTTIKYLLFFPAKLTREYLAGKRKSYMLPVQLYIFISFITFFIPSILPDFNKDQVKEEVSQEKGKELKNTKEDKDTVSINIFPGSDKIKEKGEKFENIGMDGDLLKGGFSLFGLKNIKSEQQLDSIQQKLPVEKKLSFFKYQTFKKILEKKELYTHMNKGEFKEKLSESFIHNLPKILFISMPFFALTLWLFHDKKKWYYFDHGIFTLHYFSFTLLLILISILLNWIEDAVFWGNNTAGTVIDWLLFGIFIYSVFYFFRSHSRVYGERKSISRLKALTIFLLNQFFILLIFFLYSVFIIFTIH